MAKFVSVLPDKVIEELNSVGDNTEEIFGAMTRAGAEVVEGKIKATVPIPEMANHVRLSKTYKTPTDDGINTKVYLSGYMPFKGNRTTFSRRGKKGGSVYTTKKGIPVAFISNIFEYGRSWYDFPKKPFLRKAFSGGDIEAKMLEEQKRITGGLLE